jgi:hypothetical protein
MAAFGMGTNAAVENQNAIQLFGWQSLNGTKGVTQWLRENSKGKVGRLFGFGNALWRTGPTTA